MSYTFINKRELMNEVDELKTLISHENFRKGYEKLEFIMDLLEELADGTAIITDEVIE